MAHPKNLKGKTKQLKIKAAQKQKEENAKKWGYCRNCREKTRAITTNVRVCDICGLVYVYNVEGNLLSVISDQKYFEEVSKDDCA